MIVKFLLFLAYLVFAGYILYGEIGLNSYGAKQGALNRIDQDEKDEIKALLVSPEVMAQLEAFKTRIANLNKNNATKNILNEAATHERGARVKLYDESVTITDRRVDAIQKEQEKFLASKTAPILKRHAERRARVTNDSSLISLGFAMPCAALFLCLFSAWVYPQGTLLYKNYGLLSSFLAQAMSCVITFDAVMIQQGVLFKALALSFGAFVAIPTGHYFAGLLWRQIQAEWQAWRHKPVAEAAPVKPLLVESDSPKLHAQMAERTVEESVTRRKTFSGFKAELEIPVEQVMKNIEPINYEEACQMKKRGELKMSVREIADKYNVKKWQVEAVLKEKYLLPSPSKRDIPNNHETVS